MRTSREKVGMFTASMQLSSLVESPLRFPEQATHDMRDDSGLLRRWTVLEVSCLGVPVRSDGT